MTIYTTPSVRENTPVPGGRPGDDSDMKKEISRLKSLVQDQAKVIDRLDSDLKKLRNELRTAINAFNSRHG